jgi:hypothetical protein
MRARGLPYGKMGHGERGHPRAATDVAALYRIVPLPEQEILQENSHGFGEHERHA